MKLLELFSGTGGVGVPWRAGREVISIDVDDRFGADVVEDILQLSYCKLPVPDVIWASPPVSSTRGAGHAQRLHVILDWQTLW